MVGYDLAITASIYPRPYTSRAGHAFAACARGGWCGRGVELETEPPKAARGSCAPGTSPALHAPETAVVYIQKVPSQSKLFLFSVDFAAVEAVLEVRSYYYAL